MKKRWMTGLALLAAAMVLCLAGGPEGKTAWAESEEAEAAAAGVTAEAVAVQSEEDAEDSEAQADEDAEAAAQSEEDAEDGAAQADEDAEDAAQPDEDAEDGEAQSGENAEAAAQPEEDAEKSAAQSGEAAEAAEAEPTEVPKPVMGGLLDGETFRLQELLEGFSVPVPADEARFLTVRDQEFNLYCKTPDESAPYNIYFDYRVYNPVGEFMEDPVVAAKWYDDVAESNLGIYGPMELEKDVLVLHDGHPALAMLMRVPNSGCDFTMAALFYGRNNRILRVRLAYQPQNGTVWERLPRVTMDDLRLLAEQIAYDPAQASITVADAAITLTSGTGAAALSSGKKLQLKAAFANPDRVNKEEKNDTLEWAVADAATGAAVEHVQIDHKGILTVGKKLAEVREVRVTASSPIFHTSAAYALTVMPAADGLTLAPASLIFYSGEDRAETVKAALSPDTLPAVGMTWKIRPEGVAELVPGEDGTAVIRPLKGGKATVTVTEPGGKTAKMKVSVVIPVQSVSIKTSLRTHPGSTVTCVATLLPKAAGNQAVEWSVDVGEDIATISPKGRLKISKTAPEGTVITVTCTALGAPEPVRATVEITVEK